MGVTEFFKKLLFARALVFKNGALMVLGVRSVILPGETFVREQYELLQKNEKKVHEIGRLQGKSAVELAKKFYKGSVQTKVDSMLQSVGFMGLGEIRLVAPDISTGKGRFRLTNSLMVEEYKKMKIKSKKPVDVFMAGVLEGAIEDLIGIKVKCKETKCIAKGDPYCELESKPVK